MMQRIRQLFGFLGHETVDSTHPDNPNSRPSIYPQQIGQTPYFAYGPQIYNPTLYQGPPPLGFNVDSAFPRGYPPYYPISYPPMSYPGPQPPPYINQTVPPMNYAFQHPPFYVGPHAPPPGPPGTLPDIKPDVNAVAVPMRDGNQIPESNTIIEDDSVDWPNEYQRRECKVNASESQKRKWKTTKWVWRSSGQHAYNGRRAEKRTCLGVFSCSSPTCGRLIRPKTNPASRAAQLRDGCHICCSPIVNHMCLTACTYHFMITRDGEDYFVWVHEGRHLHKRPPGGPLTAAEEDALDIQVSRNPTASAHILRTGDTTPGSVPLPEISAVLANPRAARYRLSQSQERLGISPSAASKGGLSVLKSLFDFQAELKTPFIIDSSLHGPVFIAFQTPFMKSILQASVDGWNSDGKRSLTCSGRHGFVTDGDHSFFSSGVLNMTCVFNSVTLSWLPVLYTWILRQDIDHHRPHFRHISQSVVEYVKQKTIPFERKYLLHVFDFSSAQRAAHAEEYAQAIIEMTPGYQSLSKASQEIEYKIFYDQAQEIQKGCSFHFWESAERIKSNGALVPQGEGHEFTQLLRILVDEGTNQSDFDETITILHAKYPRILNWLAWWLRPTARSMIFPAYSALDPAIAIRVPNTSNPAEHSHSLLHNALGTDHDLLPGIKKTFLHVKELEAQFKSISDGHYNPEQPRAYRPPAKQNWEVNDGRAPDTEATLSVEPVLKIKPALRPALNNRTPKTSDNFTLCSYKWQAPNSCFIDAGLELWFRAYCAWPRDVQMGFIGSIPVNSFLSSLFHHYDRRLLQLSNDTSRLDYDRNLELMQTITLDRVFDKWKLYSDRNDFGCAKTWLVHAVSDGISDLDIQGYFGVCHRIYCECTKGHSFSAPNTRAPEIWLTINDHDMKQAHNIYGPHVTTSDYFKHFIPRFRGGNHTGGTTPAHLLPTEQCGDPCCSGSAYISSISTLWPSILNINADILRSDPNKLHFENTFSIPDSTNAEVTYELVGRILHVNGNHFVSEVRFGDRCYTYNDMENNGRLIASANPRLLEIRNDQASVGYIYTRSSSKSETFRDKVDIEIDYDSPIRSIDPITLDVETSQTINEPSTGLELDNFPIESYDSCETCKFSGENSTSPSRQIMITCSLCVKKWHEACISMGADTDLTLDDTWACPACVNPHGGRWDEYMLGLYILLKPNEAAHFYPAKVLGRSSPNQVHVEWYYGNIYHPNDAPPNRIGFFTPLECLQAKNRDSFFEYTKDNLGAIKWPVRLNADAVDNYDYQNAPLRHALEGAYGAILEILEGIRDHPIVTLYNNWIKNRPRSIKMILQHHFSFTKQFMIDILPGDISLIDIFLTYLQNDTRKSKVLIESHWVTSVASVLFRLVILREYLGRRPCDDDQIFYLAYIGQEFGAIREDDIYAEAKQGSLHRVLTTPEQVIKDLGMIPGLHSSVKTITDPKETFKSDTPFVTALSNTGSAYQFFNTTLSGLVGGPKFIPNSRLELLPTTNLGAHLTERPKPKPRGAMVTTKGKTAPTPSHRVIKASIISESLKRKSTDVEQKAGITVRRSKRTKGV